MSLPHTKKLIYDFVSLRDERTYVTLDMIYSFTDDNDINREEAEIAKEQLQDEKKLYFTRRHGWRVR